jgi:hypothetical protein
MPEFRRGKEHIAKANEDAQGGGDFKPFLPNLYWKEDGDSKYLLILNPIDDIPMVKLIKAWTSEGRPEMVIARTDQAIGANKDPISEEWGFSDTDNNLAIAVELEPEYETKNGRKRPVQFVVATKTFERKVRDDDGEATDETEEVTTPVVGLIAQSPNNFWNHVAAADAEQGPIHELPAMIRRVGDGTNTSYSVTLFEDKPMDLSALFEFLDGVTYLNDHMDELVEQLADEDSEDGLDAAHKIGSLLLDLRLDEMADEENYNEVFESIDKPAKYPKKGWKKGEKSEAKAKTERRAKPSQRRSPVKSTEAKAEEPASSDVDNADEVEREQKPAKAKKEKPVTRSSPARARLDELRAKSAAKESEAA